MRYEFSNDTFNDRSLFGFIVNESYKNDCSDTVAYITDQRDHGLIVFNYATGISWRIENRLFYPYPTDFTISVNGVTFDTTVGICALTLSK